MKNIKIFSLLASIVFFSAFTIVESMTWSIEEDYSIKFNTKKAKGIFKNFTGDIVFDASNLEASKFDVKVDVKSIETGNWLKNKHAKGKNWFHADEYPMINFTSNSFASTDKGYEVTGNLEMHGITKEVSIPFTFENEVFKGQFTVNRTDFQIGATTGMSGKVGHEIELEITVPVSK